MLDAVPEAMPKAFESWCQKFDDIFTRDSQQKHFRTYLAGLLGEGHRKNIWVIAAQTVGVSYLNLHHFVHDSPWDAQALNERRIDLIWHYRQTRPRNGFQLILDDSGHRKSGSQTDGVARQYIGQLGKVDNGMVMVSSHVYDGLHGFPLDFAMYKPAGSLPERKADPDFVKKPDLALRLIDRCLERGHVPGLTLFDSGYGNNGPFLVEVEKRQLKYVAALVKSRIVYAQLPGEPSRNKHRLEDVAKALAPEDFTKITLQLEEPRDVWVAVVPIHFPNLEGTRFVAIQLNAPTFNEAKEVDYLMTNQPKEIATAKWIAQNYSDRNWIEVFYREAKGWLGMTEYQVRNQKSIERHWQLVFNAFSFLAWLRHTGGLRGAWSSQPVNTFAEAFRVFRHAVECTVLRWLPNNWDVFVAHRAKSGYKFA
jgi:hypothetical protein